MSSWQETPLWLALIQYAIMIGSGFSLGWMLCGVYYRAKHHGDVLKQAYERGGEAEMERAKKEELKKFDKWWKSRKWRL